MTAGAMPSGREGATQARWGQWRERFYPAITTTSTGRRGIISGILGRSPSEAMTMPDEKRRRAEAAGRIEQTLD